MRRRLVCGVVAALVLAAACGGGSGSDDDEARRPDASDTDASTSGSGPSTTTTAPSTTTVPFDPNALVPPPPPADPAALAAQIAAAEATLRGAAPSAEQVATAGLAQQVAYRTLGDHPEWDAAVLAAVPPELRATVERHAAIRRDLRALTGSPSSEMPAWRLVAPAPAADLEAWYREAEADTGVPWTVLAAINLVETGMGRIRGASTAGAQGPMQFLPSTWAAYGEGDIDDPREAIRAAARLLLANGAPGDLESAVFAYNHDVRYVRAVLGYADLIGQHPGAYAGVHAWGVWYWTTAGDIYLPVGWEATERVPVDTYVATHGVP